MYLLPGVGIGVPVGVGVGVPPHKLQSVPHEPVAQYPVQTPLTHCEHTTWGTKQTSGVGVGVGVPLPVGVGVPLPVGVGVPLPVGVGVAHPVVQPGLL